ncbi:CcdB family protein [Ramlibacter albus]|uniref:Toxin CcdB n=1 Tax=Ramlibacter albus TaxID=2079448 RepID=A0A923MCM3_9BURK|nr:CcdB family protein [Ramlibacter albus]MBC5766944.1 CcdB family protein [Ramlibacter albus]
MARYDVYANPDTAERKFVPFYLDVQNDFLEGMDTRVVVPLWSPAALHRRLRGLNPELSVDGKKVVMDPAAIGAVPMADLRRPVDNLASQQLEIQDALDTLLGGY